jgi:hypothetical protein
MAFRPHRDGLHEAFGQSFVQVVPETLPDPGEAHSAFNELPDPPEPTEYDDADHASATLHNPPPAAVAASDSPIASMGTSQHVEVHDEDTAASVSAIAVTHKEPENGGLSNIDMDRFSLLSLTSSASSGLASLRSLAQRILLRQREESMSRRDFPDDPPSSVMDWDGPGSSPQLFRRLSFSSSIASSQVTSGSGMSYTMLPNGSQYRHVPTENLQHGISQRPRDQHQAPSFVSHTEAFDQHSPILTNKTPPPAHTCVACNKPFKSKSSLSKHWKLHCERDKEWVCMLCAPVKNLNSKGKLLQHHIDNHGEACVQDCMQHHDLRCKEDIAWSILHLPPKKAWGCPCCHRCFDTFAAWTKHCANHPLRNGTVIGWSLNTMVQSLILQPYLTDAIAHLPMRVLDLAKVKADVCQILKEALERHKLPDAVYDHWDYRHLQLPEALAQYAFRLVAYGGPYDALYPDASLIISESAAEAISE